SAELPQCRTASAVLKSSAACPRRSRHQLEPGGSSGAVPTARGLLGETPPPHALLRSCRCGASRGAGSELRRVRPARDDDWGVRVCADCGPSTSLAAG